MARHRIHIYKLKISLRHVTIMSTNTFYTSNISSREIVWRKILSEIFLYHNSFHSPGFSSTVFVRHNLWRFHCMFSFTYRLLSWQCPLYLKNNTKITTKTTICNPIEKRISFHQRHIRIQFDRITSFAQCSICITSRKPTTKLIKWCSTRDAYTCGCICMSRGQTCTRECIKTAIFVGNRITTSMSMNPWIYDRVREI